MFKPLILLLTALCFTAMAQDINGVSLGGTPAVPSIVNHHPSKAVLGWVIAALDSSGNVIRYEENINAIDLITNTASIPAGSEFSMSQRRNRVRVGGMAEVAAYQLDSILFADGEVAGPDSMGNALTLFRSQLDSISAQDPTAALHAPLAYSHQRPLPGKQQPRDYFTGYGPTLNYYIGEVYWPDGSRTYYDNQDVSWTGTVSNPAPTDFTWTPEVGGTAVCGMDSPYAGQGVGGYDLGYVTNCAASNVSLVSRWGSNRPDGAMDRIIQTGNTYNSGSGKLQNRDVMLEGCFPGDGGSLGTPIVITSQFYGC